MEPALLTDARRIYRTIRDYGELTQTPRERLTGLLFRLFAGEGLPNILLGIALSLTVTAVFGSTSVWAAVAGWAFFFLALVNYVVAQELIYAAKVAAREFQDDPRGIY